MLSAAGESLVWIIARRPPEKRASDSPSALLNGHVIIRAGRGESIVRFHRGILLEVSSMTIVLQTTYTSLPLAPSSTHGAQTEEGGCLQTLHVERYLSLVRVCSNPP